MKLVDSSFKFKHGRLHVCSLPKHLSEGKLNFFQCSSLGLRNPHCYKSYSKGSYDCVDCKCPCRQTSQHYYIDKDIRHELYEHSPPLLQFKSKLAVIVIPHEISQFPIVAMLPARPFIFTGSI